MIRKGITGRIRPALDLPGHDDDFRQVFPFRRSWVAILVLGVFTIVFIIPAIFIFDRAVLGWGDIEDLFDLVITVFSFAWLLGWSLAPLVMSLVLVLMIFGREVVRIRNGVFELFIGIPMVGLKGRYDISSMRNLRILQPEKKSKKGWRGAHLAFDYGANSIEFGSNASDADLMVIENTLRNVSGQAVRTGGATPQELKGDWEPSVLQQISEQDAPIEPIRLEPIKWSSPTALALIVANLIPVAGTVYLGWNLGDVMVLYWAESAIIGFFNLLKMAVIGRWLALFTGTFFIAHFGAFMAVHFLFIWGIFIKGFDDASGDLNEVAQHFLLLWPALLALFVSHGFSFFTNFLGRREYKDRSIKDQMSEPYSRIILMHFVIILGGGLAMVLGSPMIVLLLIIAGKIVLDVRAHISQREKPA
ncbi:MAG TPA: DUF6498-containing protein [Xanthomonadales bacterium]|nr:DUF6498-containing protein [Xanthomonadales bacterium]